ncbi:transposase [Malacoplasma iowae]|uniref:transposase n=1 Tax=Malacoplasma iowae TaxID=2116 RepID=UPI00068BD654
MKKEILSFWINEFESHKQWLTIFNELKIRGIKDVILTCCENLKGVSKTLKDVFPNIRIQNMSFIKQEILLIMNLLKMLHHLQVIWKIISYQSMMLRLNH